MREFVLKSHCEEKWMHQNGACYVEYEEGVLVDSYMLECNRGWCAVYEKPLNEWVSTHVYKFAPYKNLEEVDALWAEWYDFCDGRDAA